MAHERIPSVQFLAIRTPEACTMCPSARAVVGVCAAALKALKTGGYNEPPDYAGKRDRSCWVTKVNDERLRAEDPTYTELVTAHETATQQHGDMKLRCPGGTIDRPPEGPPLHTCHYTPSPGIPELPIPPGTLPLGPG